MVKRGWRWLYRKARAALLGGVASGGLAHGVVQFVEEVNGDATLSASQHALIVQAVTLIGGFLAVVMTAEDHVPGPRQLQALADARRAPVRMPGEPAPTPPVDRQP